MNSRDIRRGFLEYFERRGHRIVPSSPLVPGDDPTLLFTNAGMNQFKDLFLGREQRDYKRATTSQKCMRVSGKHNDLDNVGPSLRHHTFFEMLGNFSFGDYFKDDAITFAWELLTGVWKLPTDRLTATIFGGEGQIPRDDDAHRLWLRCVPADRIVELGLADNFWQMGDTGPCGRCSEIHYFRGADIPCPEPVCLGVACNCDRYVEVWNNVFMEFDRQPDGALKPLPAPSIDTGMGLERIAAVIQGRLSNYDTDLFVPLIQEIGTLTGTRYGQNERADTSTRVVADHIRATTFLIADGVIPSNEWRGYVLRKIMRRAMRHGKRLGLRDPFLHRLVDVLVREMGDAYAELRSSREAIVRVIRSEEDRFDAVLNAGLPRLEEVLDRAAAGDRIVPGEDAFRLYDSFGVPVDFIEDLAGERSLTLDMAAFERAMEGQRDKARAASAFETKQTREFNYQSETARQELQATGDRFEGYTATTVTGARIVGVFDADRRQVEEIREGQSGYVVLDRTPFYVEAGGQVSDRGTIMNESTGAIATVTAMGRLAPGGLRTHRVDVGRGTFRPRDVVTADVQADVRDATRRNHTATHLLHAALRQVLGTHVKQAGSLVAPDRLRFDFIHFAPITRDELDTIERIVNERIFQNTAVTTDVQSTQEAIAGGAMALFGEKYGDRVRVVSIPGFSMELCGGTHCRATGDIGFFAIVAESGVAAGTRRIEAVTGAGAVAHYQAQHAALADAAQALNVPPSQVVEAVQRLQAETRTLQRDLSAARMKAAIGAPAEAAEEAVEVAGVKLITRRAAGLDKTMLRTLADTLKDRIKSGVVVIASESDGKVAVVVSVTRDLKDRAPAGQIVKRIAPIVGGGGGGRSDFAEAGGKDPSRIDELFAQSRTVVEELLSKSP
jgi:alanyl-tRNA synthetase